MTFAKLGIRLRENNAGVRENDWERYDEHAIKFCTRFGVSLGRRQLWVL